MALRIRREGDFSRLLILRQIFQVRQENKLKSWFARRISYWDDRRFRNKNRIKRCFGERDKVRKSIDKSRFWIALVYFFSDDFNKAILDSEWPRLETKTVAQWRLAGRTTPFTCWRVYCIWRSVWRQWQVSELNSDGKVAAAATRASVKWTRNTRESMKKAG